MWALAFTCCSVPLSAAPSSSSSQGIFKTCFRMITYLGKSYFSQYQQIKHGKDDGPCHSGFLSISTAPTEFWHSPASSLPGNAWGRATAQPGTAASHSAVTRRVPLSYAAWPTVVTKCWQYARAAAKAASSCRRPPAAHSVFKSPNASYILWRVEGWRRVMTSLQQKLPIKSQSILVSAAPHTAGDLGDIENPRMAQSCCQTYEVAVPWKPLLNWSWTVYWPTLDLLPKRHRLGKKKSTAWSCKKATNSPWNVVGFWKIPWKHLFASLHI